MTATSWLGARSSTRFSGYLVVWSAALAAGLLTTTGCHSASEVTTGPTAVKCGVQVQAASTGFAAGGGSGSVRISTPRECTWSAEADAGWVTLGGPSSGRGDATIPFAVAANANTATRDAHITVKDQQIVISQQGAACTVRVSSNRESVGPEGGTRTIAVTTDGGQCAWTAASDASWITIASGASGTGNGIVSFHVAATNGPARSAAVTIASQIVHVSQSNGCSVSVTPMSASVPASGGSGTIHVDAAATCTWTADSGADWITITSGASGSGAGEIRFSVPAAPGAGRAGVIRVGDQEVAITQGANCALSVTPTTLSVGAQAGTGQVDVSGAAGCEWTAESRSEWVTVTSGARGNGGGRVTLGIAANAGPERTGSISVAGQAISIAQANGCHYGVSPSRVTVPGTGGGASVSITTDGTCRWTADPNASWLAVSPGSGTGPAALQISAGPNLAESRSARVTVEGHDIAISQPSSCTFVLAPRSADFASGGGAGTVLVITTGTCSWTASSDSSWVRVTVGATGDGNGLVQFKVDSNTGPARTAHLTIAGTDFPVRQSAP